MQPGDTITPGGTPTKTPEVPEVQQAEAVQVPAPATRVESEPAPTVDPTPQTEAPKPSDNQWQPEEDTSPAHKPAPAQYEPVNWTASEYIAHEKNANWYLLLGVAVLGFSAAVFFLTKELVSSVVIVIMGTAFGAFAARKPQELDYSLDNTALHIGPRSYTYAQFKSFTMIDEGATHSITLMPLQRFMPPLSVYYAPEDEDKISTALSSYLPYEDRKQDFVDKFMRKVRF